MRRDYQANGSNAKPLDPTCAEFSDQQVAGPARARPPAAGVLRVWENASPTPQDRRESLGMVVL